MGKAENEVVGTTIESRVNVCTDQFEQARKIIGSLDMETYEVGGSIRDSLLGREAKDLDVAVVGQTIDDLILKLRKVARVKKLVVAGQTIGARAYADWTPKGGIEFALARTEISTGQGHQDFEIVRNPDISLEEDLARRDFTCNAIARQIMADGQLGDLIDPYNGQEDIQNNLLRSVGPTTIKEDPLRVLRGFARIAKDGYDLDLATSMQMQAQIDNIKPDGPLSAERIFEETSKILSGDHAGKAFRVMRDTGIFAAAYPELAPMVGFDQESKYHTLTVDEHCFAVLDAAVYNNASETVRWAALLHDSGKPETAFRGADGRLHYYTNPDVEDAKSHQELGAEISRDFLNRLKAPKQLTSQVSLLVAEHMFSEDHHMENRSQAKNEIKARRLIRKVGRDNIYQLLELRQCDGMGKGKKPSKFVNTKFKKVVDKVYNHPLTVKELAVTGHDLIELDIKGKDIGAINDILLDEVTVNPKMNNRERLLRIASREHQRLKRTEQREETDA